MADELNEPYAGLLGEPFILAVQALIGIVRTAFADLSTGFKRYLRSLVPHCRPTAIGGVPPLSQQQLAWAQEEIEAARDSAQHQLADFPSALGFSANQPFLPSISGSSTQATFSANADNSNNHLMSIESEEMMEDEEAIEAPSIVNSDPNASYFEPADWHSNDNVQPSEGMMIEANNEQDQAGPFFVSSPSTSSGRRRSSRVKKKVNYAGPTEDCPLADESESFMINRNGKRSLADKGTAAKRLRGEPVIDAEEDEEERLAEATPRRVLKRPVKRRQRKYHCTFTGCTSSFTRSTHLTDHLLLHSRVRPFVCVECAKAFTTKSSLTRHERIHAGLKLYHCKWPHCDYSACQRSNAHSHIRRFHFGLPESKKEQARRRIIDTRDAREFIEKRISN